MNLFVIYIYIFLFRIYVCNVFGDVYKMCYFFMLEMRGLLLCLKKVYKERWFDRNKGLVFIIFIMIFF